MLPVALNFLPANRPILEDDGTMSQELRAWTQGVTEIAVPLPGAGTPEGVQNALQGKLYIDTAGSTGSVLYVKQFGAIAGDKTKGWILV